MKIFNFLQTGGYPLETDTLDEMQKAYNIFNSLGALAGDKTIISGCVVTGDTISDGIVYLNGELFQFLGGTIQTTVRILETTVDKEFENGETKTVLTKRVVSFASGEGSIPWSEFRRISNDIVQIISRLDAIDLLNLDNRLTTAETKLETIEEGAEVNVQTDYTQNDSNADDYLKNKPNLTQFLLKGNYNIGDVEFDDVEKTISFPSIGTSNYLVVGSIVSKSGNFNNDNDVIWSIRSKTATSFKLLLRDMGGAVQNIEFNYSLIPL